MRIVVVVRGLNNFPSPQKNKKKTIEPVEWKRNKKIAFICEYFFYGNFIKVALISRPPSHYVSQQHPTVWIYIFTRDNRFSFKNARVKLNLSPTIFRSHSPLSTPSIYRERGVPTQMSLRCILTLTCFDSHFRERVSLLSRDYRDWGRRI